MTNIAKKLPDNAIALETVVMNDRGQTSIPSAVRAAAEILKGCILEVRVIVRDGRKIIEVEQADTAERVRREEIWARGMAMAEKFEKKYGTEPKFDSMAGLRDE